VYENYHWLLCYSNFACFNCQQLVAAGRKFELLQYAGP